MNTFTADMEIKTVSLEQRTIAAYAAAHSNIDRVRDIIDPGASAKAVSRIKTPAEIPVFVGHDENQLPIGVARKIEAHPRGLYTETLIKPGPAGDDLLHTARFMQQQGQPLGLSIKYRTRDSRHETTSRGRVRRILDYDLLHYCFASPAVTANPEATMVGIKTRRKALGEGSETGGGALVPADQKDEAMPCAACKAGNEADCACPGCMAGGDCACCALLAQEGKMQYRIEQDQGRWAVLCDADADGDDDDGRVVGVYPSQEMATAVAQALRDAARPAATNDGGMAEDDEDEEDTGVEDGKTLGGKIGQKVVWTTKYENDLPNGSFLFVEPGEDDSDGKRVPRTKRHFPYKDATGKIDLPHLRNAIARIPVSNAPGLDDATKAALQARARRMLGTADEGKTYEEPAEWQTGMPIALAGIAYRLQDLAEQVATECKAMALLGEDHKSYFRLRKPVRDELTLVSLDFKRLLDWSDTIAKGQDDRATMDRYRAEVALFDF